MQATSKPKYNRPRKLAKSRRREHCQRGVLLLQEATSDEQEKATST